MGSICSANGNEANHFDYHDMRSNRRNTFNSNMKMEIKPLIPHFEDIATMTEKDIFNKLQECDDIVQCLLYLHTFLKENKISTKFDECKLRSIAFQSCDEETSTYLWHINALIAAAKDFEHLLFGLECMFRRFLGSKNLFNRETKNYSPSKCKSKSASKSPGNENKFALEIISEDPINNHSIIQISSPVSFKMRKQKRSIQSKRKVTSRNSFMCLTVGDLSTVDFDQIEPEILEPFDVTKLAETVDLENPDILACFQQQQDEQ
eukprot:UN02561